MQANTARMFKRIFSVLKPPPDLTLSEWADRYRYLSMEESASPGRWRTDKAPYQREIMDTITNINVKKTVVMSGAQIGKTNAVILNPIGYYVTYEPSPILVMQPTIKMAEGFSKEKLSPMIRDTPVLAQKINDKSRSSGNTIMQKVFPGGNITLVGANSPTSLRSRSIRILLADEIDGYPACVGEEGDPLLLAEKRLTTYWNRKQVSISTPTVKGMSRIEVEYEHSSKGEWNVPCPVCGKLQPLKWANVIFDKENLDKIEYACEECGVISTETQWKEGYNSGKYIHADPDNPVKGFHLNTLASTLSPWSEMVRKFLDAKDEMEKGNIEPMKTWTNTELGETWEEEGETLDEEELFERREYYGCEVPDGVLYLTAGVDTQDDRFEVEVVGWGIEHESWGIKYAAIYGNLDESKIWEDLDLFLQQTFQKADGTKLLLRCVCMDSGGHYTDEVYKFCKERFDRNIFAIKGANDSAAAYINEPKKNNRQKAYRFDIGVDTGKSLLMGRLKVKKPGPGYCHFPAEEGKGYGKEYFKQLASEKKVMRYKKGRAYFAWEPRSKGKYRRNEALDCRNYAGAAIEITGLPLKAKSRQTAGAPGKKRRGRIRNGGLRI